jgi:aminoglycoside/choline kinase family phosphotransferase
VARARVGDGGRDRGDTGSGIGSAVRRGPDAYDLASLLWERTAAERAAHDAWAEGLVREILGHPSALCHRDYHSNNLFPAGEEVAVIDFQDLRRGPDAYDLASLLWERTTLAWMTEETARAAVERFAAARGIPGGPLAERLPRVLLQRAWKVCGTFARAIVERRADLYRRYLPAQLQLVRRLLAQTSEDKRFRAVLEDRCGPALLS